MPNAKTAQPITQQPAFVFDLLTRKEAAVEARCTIRTIDKYVACGLLTPRRVGRKVFISRRDLWMYVYGEQPPCA